MQVLIHGPESCTIWPKEIQENSVSRKMNWWKSQKLQRCRNLPFIFLGVFHLSTQTFDTAPGSNNGLWALSRPCAVMTFLSSWDLTHSCRPDRMIHSSFDCKSKQDESKSNHSPFVASDVPRSLRFLPLRWQERDEGSFKKSFVSWAPSWEKRLGLWFFTAIRGVTWDRQSQNCETISSFSQHQKNVPSTNITTLKRTGRMLVCSLKWETDNCVLSLLWQDASLSQWEKSNWSMNFGGR